MIDFVQLLAVVLAALFFTTISLFVFHSRGPWGNYWSSFLIMFLGIWAAQVWIEPMGPVYAGVAWLPLLLAGIYLSVLLIPVGSIPQDEPEQQNIALQKQQAKQRKEDWTFGVLNASFWLLLLVFVLIVALGYLR